MFFCDTKVFAFRHGVNNDLGCPPAQDASHHQDYHIFRFGDPKLKPSFATGILGGGTTPNNDPC